MKLLPPQLHISDGKSQDQRRLPQLSGDYFKPNEWNLAQLLAMATEYARLVKFYQLDLRADSDWQQYFQDDEAVLLAAILALDLGQLEAGFEARLEQGPPGMQWVVQDLAQDMALFHAATPASPLLLARLLDYWLVRFSSALGQAGLEMTQLLESVLSGLDYEVQSILATAPQFVALLRSSFSSRFVELVHWPLQGAASVAESTRPAAGQATTARANFHALLQAMSMVQKGARQVLPQSLQSGQHDPATALLITFLQLFEKMQMRLNRFGQQHLDFYYQQVLQIKPRSYVPDSAFLLIRPAPGVRQVVVEAGSQFIAGVDANGDDVHYCADRTVVLTDARVMALHTLFFPHTPVSPEPADQPKKKEAADQPKKKEPADQPKKIEPAAEELAQTLACYQDSISAVADEEHEKLPPLPLMGAPKPGSGYGNARPARFGFALACKVLLMREGERRVRVLLQYRNPPGKDLRACLQQLAREMEDEREPGRASQRDDRLFHHDGSIINDVFIKLFRSMFRLTLTIESGWHEVPEYRPIFDGLEPDILPPDCLALEFVLPPDVPAIVPWQAAQHGDAFDTVLPVLRIEMLQNEYRYPYDLLKRWVLQDIRIEVAVRGCRQLLLHNQIGQLSALSPFMPFGPVPGVGAYFVLGHEEILCKQLSDMEIEIEWSGLPQATGGFVAHYQGYANPLKSDEVMLTPSVLADGKWINEARQIRLFSFARQSDGSPGNRVAHQNTLSYAAVTQFHKPLPRLPKGDFAWTPSSTSGLFKLSLDGPEGVFGHQEYPHLLTRVLTANARQKSALLQQPLPNPPYTPEISRIVLHYQACSVISFELGRQVPAGQEQELEKMIHLHPFGVESLQSGKYRDIYQVPDYAAPGNLFIGLQAVQLSGPLSLYFYLREDSLPMTGIADSGLCWWYLSGNNWQRLPRARIMEDATDGFMTSGIICLDLPGDLTNDNTVMPASLFWLRVSGKSGIERFCSVYSIYAQAIKVNWQGAEQDKTWATLPAGSINRSKTSLPGVDSIVQVRKSFGGKSRESTAHYRTRIAERLRHKQRALTPADYEMLILEAFPQIHKVKCFANLRLTDDPAQALSPGHILIIAIPYLTPGGHSNQKPMLSGHLIHEVAEFIRQLAPPFASISVENPLYEEIQVRCHIKLKPGLRGGRYNTRITEALCEFISPWHPLGYTRHFGWVIRQHDLVAYLLDMDFIDSVSNFSLLRIAPTSLYEQDLNDERYVLHDNAQGMQKDLWPVYPWSIAVPMNHHTIVIDDPLPDDVPVPVGIAELEIGATFIIPSRTEP